MALTPKNLRDEAARLRRLAAEEAARIVSTAEGRAMALEKIADQYELDGVTRLPSRNTARTMTGVETSREYKIGKAKVSDHPFPNALYARGTTVREWAEANGLKREKVRSWFILGAGGRRIPRAEAERIEREFGVPLSAWPHGVK